MLLSNRKYDDFVLQNADINAIFRTRNERGNIFGKAYVFFNAPITKYWERFVSLLPLLLIKYCEFVKSKFVNLI